MKHQIDVPCLGRQMTLGMLYDCRSDTPIQAVTLWDANTLCSNTEITSNPIPCETSEFDMTTNDSMENKAHSLKVDAGVKISFLGGLLLNVEGAAKYLNNNRSSAYQARVVLKYSCRSRIERLKMDHLVTKNIKYPDAFDYDMATHVVTAIEYGADAFFVFDRRENSSESCRNVEGKLKANISKIPILNIGWSGDGVVPVQMNEEEKKLTNGFECTFHGDVVLPENPTSYDDALGVYKKLPTLIRGSTDKGKIYGVPKRAYLYPLSKLDNRAATLARSISDTVVCKTQSILEYIVHVSAVANDLENTDICRKFSGVKQQVVKFKSLLSLFRSSLQKMLCEMLPRIRGGRMKESQLLEKLEEIKNSPYDISKLKAWVETKQREFASLDNYLEALKEFPFAFEAGELERVTQANKPDYKLCFLLGNIISSENVFLDLMEAYESGKDEDMNDCMQKALEKSWCDDEEVTAKILSKIDQFKNFVEANSGEKKFSLVVAVASSKKSRSTDSSCNIILFDKKGQKVFQPPSSPGQPEMKSNAENEITISWSPPTVGAKSVLFYNILYQPVGATASSSWSQIETGKWDTQFTVKQLVSKTEYLFKIEAVSEPGKSQAGPQSLPIKTKSTPPPDPTILQECQKIAEGKDGHPSLYQLPMRESYIDETVCLKRVYIGKAHPDPRTTMQKVLLLVGATGEGKRTLVNGMVNYLYGVKKDDPFRVQLIPKESNESQTHSLASVVTQYVLHWQPENRVPCTVVFIVTPGYADTSSVQIDGQLIQQLKVLFSTAAIDHIDGIGFVMRSTLSRVTETQKCIFQCILSLFGKDVVKNVYLMLTFADGSTPPILSAIRESGIQYESYFKFNSSAFTMEPIQGAPVALTNNAIKINGMFWDMAYAAYQDFFNMLSKAVQPVKAAAAAAQLPSGQPWSIGEIFVGIFGK